jgi:hypothetical protein
MSVRPPATKTELIERIEQTWRDFVAALDAVPTSERDLPGVCGYWTVAELLQHITYWEAKVPEYIQRDRLGLPEQEETDADRENRVVVGQTAQPPIESILRALYLTHGLMTSAIWDLPEPISTLLFDDIACESWDHYPEHSDQLREWAAISAAPGKRYQAVVTGTLALAATIPGERRALPGACGVWSVKDILGHLAFWDEARIHEINHKHGRLAEIPDYDAYDENDQERGADEPWEQVVDRVRSVAGLVADVLATSDESGIGNPIHTHWLEHYHHIRDCAYSEQ